MWRSGFVGLDDDFAREKNVKVVGTNVISFESVINKEEKLFAFGCYFSPFDKEGNSQRFVKQALRDKPVGTVPLVIS